MRVVFYGITEDTIKTAEKFIEKKHDVVIVDPSKEKIEELSEQLDCGFLIGEPSYPSIMEEVNPEATDYFFALSDNNQNNLVACLVARSLGIDHTILRVDDPSFVTICEELDLTDIIIPSEITSQHLFDVIFSEHLLELFHFIKDKVSLAKMTISSSKSLDLPSKMKPICYFRDQTFNFVDDSTKFEEGDEVIVMSSHEDRDALIKKINEDNESN